MDYQRSFQKLRASSRNYCTGEDPEDLDFRQVMNLLRDDEGDELHRLDVIFDCTKGIDYEVYLMDISYFSGKLEAYFRYKRINFTRIEITHTQMHTVSYSNTGLQQVPVVYDIRNGRWLRDTTSIICHIEQLCEEDPEGSYYEKGRTVIPSCPVQKFMSFLLEDFADEYFFIGALYYRWNFRLDAGNLARRFVMHDFARESPIPLPEHLMQLVSIERQYSEYVLEAGIRDKKSKRYTEHVYRLTLKYLQNHFESTGHRFMLGERPTMFDFGLFASMFRHYSLDPTPAKIMRLTAPSVFEWCARMWNSSSLSSDSTFLIYAEPGSIPYTWRPFLKMIGTDYLPFLMENAKAIDRGDDRFTSGCYTRIKVKPFHCWCAKRLIERWHALPSEGKARVGEILTDVGCAWDEFIELHELFERTSKSWGPGQHVEPPFCPSKENIPSKSTVVNTALGTPHHERPSLRKLVKLGPLVKLLILFQFASIASLIQILIWLSSAKGTPFPRKTKKFLYIVIGILTASRIQSSLM